MYQRNAGAILSNRTSSTSTLEITAEQMVDVSPKTAAFSGKSSNVDSREEGTEELTIPGKLRETEREYGG